MPQFSIDLHTLSLWFLSTVVVGVGVKLISTRIDDYLKTEVPTRLVQLCGECLAYGYLLIASLLVSAFPALAGADESHYLRWGATPIAISLGISLFIFGILALSPKRISLLMFINLSFFSMFCLFIEGSIDGRAAYRAWLLSAGSSLISVAVGVPVASFLQRLSYRLGSQ